MRPYETLLILDARLEEEPLEDEVNSIQRIISSNQGEIVHTERWGARKLSYTINKAYQGDYTLIRFNGEPSLVDVLDRSCKLNDRVLRHMTKRVKKHPAHILAAEEPSQTTTGEQA